MDSPVFARLKSDDRIYYLENRALTRSDYSIAFLPEPSSGPDRLTLAETWAQTGGIYLFLTLAPADIRPAELEMSVRQLLNDPAFQQVRWLWIENPAEPLPNWRFSYLAVKPSGTAATVRQPTFFDFRNFSLFVAGNSLIQLTNNGFTITRANDNPQGFYVTTAFGNTRLNGVGQSLTLSLTGDTAGCWQFALTLQRDRQETDYTELAALDISLRQFFKDPTAPGSATDFTITSVRYPLFGEDQAALALYDRDLTLNATLDPLYLLDGTRTYLRFEPAANSAPLPSGYRTNLGYTIHLKPQDCRLILALIPALNQRNLTDAVYWVPSGSFAMTVPIYPTTTAIAPPKQGADNLLCGLSGVEYIKLSPDHPNLLCFRPGFAAFAPGFVPNAKNQATDHPLTDLATTAWAYVQQTQAPIYYAQPDQAILHQAIAPGDPLLRYLEVPATALPAAPTQLPVFPLLPYGGVRGALTTYVQLEQQVLTPQRRSVISQAADHNAAFSPRPASTPPVQGTTPQGLLATFSGDYNQILTLLLAKDTANQLLQFQQIDRSAPLRAALQSNQLFLVISNPQRIESYFKINHQLVIQGWTFNLDPTQWRKDTVLIFKFADQPLLDLVQDLNTWTQRAEFTEGVTTQSQLVELLQGAIAKGSETATAKDRENYGPLAKAAIQANWSGILALNVPVPPKNLPEELRAIAAGLDPAKFYAHYVGIETTPIQSDAKEGLVAGQSSLMGLIDYRDDGAPLPTAVGYNFQVTSLRVLFQNSQVKAFSSEILITLDLLFGERTQLLNRTTDRNIILLKGTAETHDGRTTYAFSFSGENHFALPDSKVLTEVEIIKAQFSTAQGANNTVVGRFTFWGRLDFQHQPKFDVFSFGANPSAAPAVALTNLPAERSALALTAPPNAQFLSFANLVVAVSFPPDQPTQRTFNFDPTQIAFDTKRSQVRPDSLYAKFPLKLTGLRSSNGTKKLDDAGYMPVKSPLGSGKLDTHWYGLTFELQLGSLGALAGKAGLVATILAAWSPVEPDDAPAATPTATTDADFPSSTTKTKGGDIFIGLGLPGVTGGKREITLQGILKLAFKSIEFVVGTTGPPEHRPSYLLKLKNIVLKVLILSLPPNAQTEIIIFGDPQGTAENNTVGWYAAYAKEPSPPALPAGK